MHWLQLLWVYGCTDIRTIYIWQLQHDSLCLLVCHGDADARVHKE